VCGGAVMGKQVVQKGTKHTPLRGSRSDGQLGGWVVAYSHHLGAARRGPGSSCRGRCSVPGS
jgi:hypothetical protein